MASRPDLPKSMNMRLPANSPCQFWQFAPSDAPALFERGAIVSRRDLLDRIDQFVLLLTRWKRKSFGFLSFVSSSDAVAAYLACLRSGRAAPLLWNPSNHPDVHQAMADHYRPDWILVDADAPLLDGYGTLATFGGMRLDASVDTADPEEPHPDLALLLATSGSTGSAKLVRLSYSALAANTGAIISYLGMSPADRTISTLPFAYSFGMSVLNTHIGCGGAIALSSYGLLTREFWSTAAEVEVTNLSGVPSSFEMLRRAGLEKRGLTKLRFLAQAGGGMRADLTRLFEDLARQHGWSLYVMYGQTEAGPRISFVPPDRLAEKIGSIGIPVPGGTLDLRGEVGEIVVRSPNVMMGYAEIRVDLGRGDECNGLLRTGDLARRDEDGFFFLTGRMKRFVKLSGVRIGLDSIEQRVEERLGVRVACTGRDDQLHLWLIESEQRLPDPDVTALLRDLFDIFPGHVRLHRVEELPINANGKTDYSALSARSEEL